MSAAVVGPVARQRRHTLQFLRYAETFSPVHLDTDVDMTAVLEHRAAARAAGRRYSVVSYVLRAGATALVTHPEANAAVHGRRRPRVAHFPHVTGKLALDRRMGGHRVVLSAFLPELDLCDLDAIQAVVDHYRDGDPDTMPEFGGARLLHRLPSALGTLAFRTGVRSLRRRPALLGTLAVSSLGHRPVDGFHSVGGTTITLGLGRVHDQPVVRDGGLAVAPMMRLSLTFDHRVIDGGEAADVLTDIRSTLESPWDGRAAVAILAAGGEER